MNAANGVTAAINISLAITAPGGIDLRGNIFANTQTMGLRFAIIDASLANAALFSGLPAHALRRYRISGR